ncbi:MAG: GAF domain-containing protein [Anaerolineae bacterium]|nr:GAF domain-containing protein [Anaerolineae bacterium]
MIDADLNAIALSVEVALYLLLATVALRRGALGADAGRAILLYALVSGLWVVEQLAWRLGWLAPLNPDVYLMARLPLYGLVLLALIFLYVTRAFLRLKGRAWGWAVLGVAWITMVVLLDASLIDIHAWAPMLATWNIGHMTLTFGASIGGWALFMGMVLAWTVRSFRQAKLPLHRNRIAYWFIAWSLTAIGDLAFFYGQEIIGSDVRLLGTLVSAYVVLTHRQRDVPQAMRRALSYLVVTALTVAIYTGGFYAVQYFFQNAPAYDPLLAGAAVAVILAVLFDPLRNLVQKGINRLVSGAGYDPSQIVSQYGTSISNIVDLERLATVAIQLLREAFAVRHGTLFVVDRHKGGGGLLAYEVEAIPSAGQEKPPKGLLDASSPLTNYLWEERQPLTQYDIDLLPTFKDLPQAEREWLHNLDADVYVPIYAGGSWIGLLALGSKISGDRYYDKDLALLGTLADQTAVALENARLVDDLVQVNQDLQNTYMELAQANRELQEMDRLKSAFIGVITHELRSPFANIAFSLQVFTRYGVENLSPEQREQLNQLTNSLHQAKAMVDNLVTFATFLSKQGALSLASVAFGEVVNDTLKALEPMARNKEQALRVAVPTHLPPLQGDPDRLSDAIHHLVQNAIKFTGKGGEIWVRSRVENSQLVFEVKDNGVGVAADKLEGLWEGFAQMADPLRRGVEGLGLGLALVKYIVTAHGGQVFAHSEVGKGSIFGFRIPLTGPEGR